MPPWPVPEALSFPGLALIALTRSSMFLYGEVALTVMAAGSTFISASGV